MANKANGTALSNDFTQGSIVGKLIKFMIPVLRIQYLILKHL